MIISIMSKVEAKVSAFFIFKCFLAYVNALPSYDFRKMLCCMNPENKNAAIFMNETANYTVVPLGATMANFDFLNEEDDIFH